jgi:hypothetical protein
MLRGPNGTGLTRGISVPGTKGSAALLKRFPFKGPLLDVTPSDVARTLKGMKSRSTYDHALVGARIFFNWGVKRRYLTENPTVGMLPHETRNRARVLTDQDLVSIWKAYAGGGSWPDPEAAAAGQRVRCLG